jgi:hypothetical protein
MSESPSIVCPHCGKRSYNLNDIKYRYCGSCREFHETLVEMVDRHVDKLLKERQQDG